MNSRNYNKLYVSQNREGGSEKLLLGYHSDTKETILIKDSETFFHIPFYTTPLRLDESTLIQEGATGGPFPAAADRIYKNRKNYGNITANGNPSDIADGGWLCSWLYKNEFGISQWMDRFYNPGKLTFPEAISQLSDQMVYDKNDPIFRDIPSSMYFDPGVMYRYVHMGEKTALRLITTFGGLNGEHLKLNLENWGSEFVDTSLSAKLVNITTNANYTELYPLAFEADRVLTSVISFNNNKETEVSVEYNESYALENEFSLSFWAHSTDWNKSQTTQLVGNCSSSGGVGVFIDTLSSYPFFVISETAYGHMLYVNEGQSGFLDQNLSLTSSVTSTPQFVAIDSDYNVIVCNSDSSKKLLKLDHTGKTLLATTLPPLTENVMQILCDPSDGIIVITNKNRYSYNHQLNLISTTSWSTLSTTIASYAYDSKSGFCELNIMNNVFDSKFIETTNWCISASDGNLYRKLPNQANHELFAKFNDKATAFGIDPYNNIWILHGTNNASIIDTSLNPLSDPLTTFDVGLDSSLHLQKNISFFCCYSRVTQTREWKAIIYYNDHSQIYVFDIKGNLSGVIDVLSLFDYKITQKLKQDSRNFTYNGKGDFTGYERKRVFNNISPYNNSSQLVLKASLKNRNQSNIEFVQFKSTFSIKDWIPNSWQHVFVTLKNRKFELYVNGKLASTLEYSGQYELSYENQPSFFIGSPVGNQIGFNEEIKYTSNIFNGMIQDVKIFDYVLNPKALELFQRAVIPAENIAWSLPIPSTQYIETVNRMFKNKIPGAKSTYFNIKLIGTQIQDPQTRIIIEEEIRNIVSALQPAYANFLKITWTS